MRTHFAAVSSQPDSTAHVTQPSNKTCAKLASLDRKLIKRLLIAIRGSCGSEGMGDNHQILGGSGISFKVHTLPRGQRSCQCDMEPAAADKHTYASLI